MLYNSYREVKTVRQLDYFFGRKKPDLRLAFIDFEDNGLFYE